MKFTLRDHITDDRHAQLVIKFGHPPVPPPLFRDIHSRLINAIQAGKADVAYSWTRIVCHMATCSSPRFDQR